MGRHIPNQEQALVLSRLADLEVSPATKAIFERYSNGELTIRHLNSAIGAYLDPRRPAIITKPPALTYTRSRSAFMYPSVYA